MTNMPNKNLNIKFSKVSKTISGSITTDNFIISKDSGISDNDYIVRYIAGQLQASMPTETFKDIFNERLKKIANVSDEVISSLRKEIEYNGFYIAYLLKQLSQSDFDEIVEKYSVNFTETMTDELREKLRILFLISHENFSSSDLSNIFKVEERAIDPLLVSFKQSGYIE